jgi:hypothetical protein
LRAHTGRPEAGTSKQADHGAQPAIVRRICDRWAVVLLPIPASTVRHLGCFYFCPVVYAATGSHGAITPCAARSSTCQLKPPSAIAAAGLAELDLLLWRRPWRGGAVFLCLCRQSARQSSSFCTESCHTHQRPHDFVLPLTPRLRGRSLPGADSTPGLLRFCQQGWCRGERVSG